MMIDKSRVFRTETESKWTELKFEAGLEVSFAVRHSKKMKIFAFLQFADKALNENSICIERFVRSVEFKITNLVIKEYVPSSHLVKKKTKTTNRFVTPVWRGFNTFHLRVIVHFSKEANRTNPMTINIPGFKAEEGVKKVTSTLKILKKDLV